MNVLFVFILYCRDGYLCYNGETSDKRRFERNRMLIREQMEQREIETLSPYAALSVRTLGRDRPEEECDIRTCYQRDRDRILHCKAFRRLKHKTQVFLAPAGDHYRTRLTHTLEVSQIARTIGKALCLNEDLIEAIALGHDLGHTPFGHAGERALDEISPLGFAHHEQSARVVEVVEHAGEGLNLTKEVRDGIRNHKTSGRPMTLEGQVVRYSDKIAYLHHDIDDAIRANILREEEIPVPIREVLGDTAKIRLDVLIHDVIENSMGQDTIYMSGEREAALMDLRNFMFDHVYTNPVAKTEEYKGVDIVKMLYTYYMEHPDAMSAEYVARAMTGEEEMIRTVVDYVAGMTDQYAIDTFAGINIPKSWRY